MTRANVILFLAFIVLSGCNKKSEDTAQSQTDVVPVVAVFEATCTVTESSRSLGVLVLRDEQRRCTVFMPEPIEGAEFSVALRADSDARTVAAELLNDEDERLYATDGEVSIVIADGRIIGQLDARDQNAPAVGRLRIAIDAPMP